MHDELWSGWHVVDRRIIDANDHCIATFCGSEETANETAMSVLAALKAAHQARD